MPTTKSVRVTDRSAWLALVSLFLVPAAAIGAGSHLALLVEREGEVDPTPLLIRVERDKFRDTIDVEAALQWSPGPSLKAPAWAGLVTEVAVEPGQTVRSGDRIIRVDGIWRLAAATPTPFFAPVNAQSSTEEIAKLSGFLIDLGYEVPPRSWDSSTVASLRDLADSVGVASARDVEAFDPAWSLWMPTKSVIIGSVTVDVGSPAPAPGEDVATGLPRLAAVSVASADGDPQPTAEQAMDWVLRIDDMDIPYESLASPAELRRLDPPPAFATQMPESMQGVLERETPLKGWRVPVTAVHTDVSGAQCVFRLAAAEGVYEAVPAVVARSGVGVARVTANLDRSDQILANPGELLRGRSCG